MPQIQYRSLAWKKPGKFLKQFGFPVIIRPSFTMGGSGGGIAYNQRRI
ncbi:MAG: hypothetical protein ACFHHU_14330 [Porticoccaceae bacterium]